MVSGTTTHGNGANNEKAASCCHNDDSAAISLVGRVGSCINRHICPVHSLRHMHTWNRSLLQEQRKLV